MRLTVSHGLAVLAAMALILSIGAAQNGARAVPPTDAPTVVLNITSGKEDLHAVTMALQLAGHALDDGRRVVVFLNVRAPEFAHKSLPDACAFHGNPPIAAMLRTLTQRGAAVLVCPACAEVMGIGKDDLMDRAAMATRETLFADLGANAVVFSY